MGPITRNVSSLFRGVWKITIVGQKTALRMMLVAATFCTAVILWAGNVLIGVGEEATVVDVSRAIIYDAKNFLVVLGIIIVGVLISTLWVGKPNPYASSDSKTDEQSAKPQGKVIWLNPKQQTLRSKP